MDSQKYHKEKKTHSDNEFCDHLFFVRSIIIWSEKINGTKDFDGNTKIWNFGKTSRSCSQKKCLTEQNIK